MAFVSTARTNIDAAQLATLPPWHKMGNIYVPITNTYIHTCLYLCVIRQCALSYHLMLVPPRQHTHHSSVSLCWQRPPKLHVASAKLWRQVAHLRPLQANTHITSPSFLISFPFDISLPDAGAWRTALLPLILFPFACCSVLLRLHDIAGWRGRGDSGSSISAHKPLLMRFAQLLPFTSAHTQTHTPWQLNVEMIVRFCFFKCKYSQVLVCVCGCGRVRALQFVASLNAIFAVK